MKIATLRTKINLGVFVLCIAVLLGLCIIIAGDDVSFFRKSQTYKTRFQNTAGLVAGAPVRMGGVEVGRVSKIEIETLAEGVMIGAELKIDSPYYELVRKDASVMLDNQGLLGDKFVTLTAGSAAEALPEGSMIRAQDADNLQKVVEQSKAIMETVQSTTKKIDEFTESLPDEHSMKAVGEDFRDSARSLKLIMGKLSADDSMISALNDAESKRRLLNALRSLESAAAHADSIAGKIDSGQGTLGALVNDRTLYEDLRSMLGHIDRGRIARRVFIEAKEGEPSTRANEASPKR